MVVIGLRCTFVAPMKYSSKRSAQSVIYHCKARAIQNIVISPGSRNAPLTIGFTEDEYFNCYSIVDERCAAFFALGIAQQIMEPVVLVCTSGSALLNYYPAISEAYYSDIPLIVISADRPSHKIDIGDGQTIRQENVFANHIGYSANLKIDFDDLPVKAKEHQSDATQIQQFNDKELNNALLFAIEKKSPVHINVPFEEPLYEMVNSPTVSPEVQISNKSQGIDLEVILRFTGLWNSSSKKMILVGTHAPELIDEEVIERLGHDSSVLVFTETTSNLNHPNFFPSIDSIIAPIEKNANKDVAFKALQPQILLTFGGMIVSKKIKAFLRKYPPEQHWHVDVNKANDTFFCLKEHVKCDANTFLNEVVNRAVSVKSNYYNHWDLVRSNYILGREKYLKKIPFSDLSVFDLVTKAIPQGYQVQLANSSTVRYAQLFDKHSSLKVFCNRGTSGIDGSTSTAIGASLHCPSPTLLITGDLSFLYDSNALWNNYLRPDFRIIVINNQGGGIFRILPGKEATAHFETYFETVQNLNFESLCNFYEIEYCMADSAEQLGRQLLEFYQASARPKLMEIKTPRPINDEILLNYFDFIS